MAEEMRAQNYLFDRDKQFALTTPVGDLDLPTVINNIFARHHLTVAWKVLRLSRHGIRRLPGMGKQRIQTVRDALEPICKRTGVQCPWDKQTLLNGRPNPLALLNLGTLDELNLLAVLKVLGLRQNPYLGLPVTVRTHELEILRMEILAKPSWQNAYEQRLLLLLLQQANYRQPGASTR